MFLIAALTFGLVSGANDGGTLVSVSARSRGLTPLTAVGLMGLLVAVGPLVLGTKVARTLAGRLVSFQAAGGSRALLTAVAVAIAVVLALSWAGLPTSLTLALLGGIVGAGLGTGLPVAWGTVGAVVVVALVGLPASVGAGVLAARLVERLPGRPGPRLRWLHRAGFTVQCLAYAANDAQKMVAILLAGGAGGAIPPVDAAAIAASFVLGTLLAVRRTAMRLGERLMRVRPVHAVASELASSAVVLASSALGAPVSTTQATTAALVGAGVTHSRRRVRWNETRSIGAAWALTLPASVALAWGSTLVLRSLG